MIEADTVVIGAGVAGATAAALLAQRGHRVVVLERDVHPGGCAASFGRDGYRFAVGATVGMGFEPGGIHHAIYRRLGLVSDAVPVSPAIRVHLPDRVVRVETSRRAWYDEVARAFPGGVAAKRAFWRRVALIGSALHRLGSRFPVLPVQHPNDLIDGLGALHPSLLRLLPNLARTVADLLDLHGIDDPAHRAFIDGQLLDAVQVGADAAVAANGALALDIYRHGCFYKPGGLGTVASDLLEVVTASGGEIRYATRARRIVRRRGNVAGVETSRGFIAARSVVSAIPLANTADLLGDDVPENLARRREMQPPMWGAFTLYLGVDERVLPAAAGLFEQVTDYGDHRDAGNLLISISPSWDRSRAPEGKRAVTVSTHVAAERWLELARDRDAYRHAKAELEEGMLSMVSRALPGIREGIEVCMGGTPRTFRSFTLRSGGQVGGFPQSLAHANFRAPSHRSGLRGLYLAGDTVFPGQGTLGVSVSGYHAARSAARHLLENKALSAPQRPPILEVNR